MRDAPTTVEQRAAWHADVKIGYRGFDDESAESAEFLSDGTLRVTCKMLLPDNRKSLFGTTKGFAMDPRYYTGLGKFVMHVRRHCHAGSRVAFMMLAAKTAECLKASRNITQTDHAFLLVTRIIPFAVLLHHDSPTRHPRARL